jgi:hypothetical protein
MTCPLMLVLPAAPVAMGMFEAAIRSAAAAMRTGFRNFTTDSNVVAVGYLAFAGG